MITTKHALFSYWHQIIQNFDVNQQCQLLSIIDRILQKRVDVFFIIIITINQSQSSIVPAICPSFYLISPSHIPFFY